jgi:hypothetical protein
MPDPSHRCSNPNQNHRDGVEDEYSEMEATIMERQTPGGFKCTSAPGQSKSPSVRRTRRDDFDIIKLQIILCFS